MKGWLVYKCLMCGKQVEFATDSIATSMFDIRLRGYTLCGENQGQVCGETIDHSCSPRTVGIAEFIGAKGE